jgi:hypothetical protein
MLGNSRPIPFNPYGSRRPRRRLPPWLALLVIGIALGVGAVLVVQDRYLPPRLSAAESVKLRAAYTEADGERTRLQAELAANNKDLQLAVSERKAAVDELATETAGTQQLRDDISAVIAALPPDPRGGAVQVRAARFASEGGALRYDLILTRDRAGEREMPAVLQLTVAGTTARGVESAIALKPVALNLGSQEVARGSLDLPDGFKPRQTTVSVLDRAGGKALGMRVLLLK